MACPFVPNHGAPGLVRSIQEEAHGTPVAPDHEPLAQEVWYLSIMGSTPGSHLRIMIAHARAGRKMEGVVDNVGEGLCMHAHINLD